MSIARRCRSFGVACRGVDRGEISVRFADADIGASHREGFPFADHVALARGRFELDCRAGHQRAAPFLPSGKAWPVMERGPLEGLPGTILGAAFHGGSRQWLSIWAGWPRLGASLATKRVPVTLLATGSQLRTPMRPRVKPCEGVATSFLTNLHGAAPPRPAPGGDLFAGFVGGGRLHAKVMKYMPAGWGGELLAHASPGRSASKAWPPYTFRKAS